MKKVNHEIAVQERKDFGTNAARRARKTGMIPACIYSKGNAARSLYVDADAWKVISGHHGAHLITLLQGESKTMALVQAVQKNHLKNYVQHIDFLEVSMNEEIHAKVDLVPMGEAIGAAHGGILEQELHQLAIKCKPTDLPEEIKVDVSALDIGESLHLKDLVLPEGVKAVGEEEEVVFHVVMPREEPVEEAPAADAAAEGDAAAAPAADAAKAGDAKAGAKASK